MTNNHNQNPTPAEWLAVFAIIMALGVAIGMVLYLTIGR